MLSTPTEGDAARLVALCKKNAWLAHQAAWMQAYQKYVDNGGDPWVVCPVVFDPNIGDEQYALYDKRKGGGPIKRIRETRGLLCCPMCGSGATGTLDHYLPRTEYPEFSIFLPNLVPSCMHCNSDGKGKTYKGDAPERFLHPYFDRLAQRPIWLVEFIPPFAAIQFRGIPMPGLSGDDASRIGFHLSHVLGEQFHRTMENEWATLPQRVRDRLDDRSFVTEADVKGEIVRQLRDAITSTGLNSWSAAFLRGLAANGAALVSVVNAVRPLRAQSLP